MTGPTLPFLVVIVFEYNENIVDHRIDPEDTGSPTLPLPADRGQPRLYRPDWPMISTGQLEMS